MIRTEKWVFIHIPKTSGRNFIINSKKSSKELVDYFSKFHNDFSHQPLWWWENLNLIRNSDYIFTIVRNPYDRFVSLYNHIKSEIPVQDFKNFVKNDQIFKLDYELEKRVGKYKKLLKWRLWHTQSNFIQSQDNNSVNIYKIESDLKQLEEFVGYTFTKTYYNQRPHAHWTQYYDKYTLDAINTIYKEDFLLFDYKIRK